MWNPMFEKEIKEVGKNKVKRVGEFNSSDGDIQLGKVFILYENEMDELTRYKTKFETLETNLNNQQEKYQTQIKKITKLENQITEKDDEIKQLKQDNKELDSLRNKLEQTKKELKQVKEEKDNLQSKNDDLNTSITIERTTMKQNYNSLDDKYETLIDKYNSNVDMIHSLITTIDILINDNIKHMSLKNRLINFKPTLNSYLEQNNLNNLIEQHRISDSMKIPEKTSKKNNKY